MATGKIEKDKFITKKFSYSYSNLANGSALNITSSNLNYEIPDGYIPFAFSQFTTGQSGVQIARLDPTCQLGGSSNFASLRNRSGASRSNTFSATVTFIREDLVIDVNGLWPIEVDSTYANVIDFWNFGLQEIETSSGIPMFEPFRSVDHLWFSPSDDIAVVGPITLDNKTISKVVLNFSDGTTQNITPTDNNDGTFGATFTMPSKGVVISATYS